MPGPYQFFMSDGDNLSESDRELLRNQELLRAEFNSMMARQADELASQIAAAEAEYQASGRGQNAAHALPLVNRNHYEPLPAMVKEEIVPVTDWTYEKRQPLDSRGAR